MNRACKLSVQHIEDHALAHDPRGSFELSGDNFHIEMALAPLAIAAMTAVAFAIVNDLHTLGRKRRFKFLAHCFCNRGHIFPLRFTDTLAFRTEAVIMEILK